MTAMTEATLEHDIRAGFSTRDISACVADGTPFRHPLAVTCAAFCDSDHAFLLVAFDLLELTVACCDRARAALSRRLGIPAECIVLHTTHTHSVPWLEHRESEVLPALVDAVAECVREALAAARPVRVRTGRTDVGSRLSIHRRGDAGPDLGVQTFWFGYQFRDGDDRPEASALANEMRTRWLGGKGGYAPSSPPIWFDRPVDPLVQAMLFEDADGHAVGSLVRFCAHPHLTSACRDRQYDPDFPGRTRDIVESRTGAPCLFLLGPSANLVPKERVRYLPDESRVYPNLYLGPTSAFFPEEDGELLAETDRIGSEIADAALKAVADAPAVEVKSIRACASTLELPLDPNLPMEGQACDRARAVLTAEFESGRRNGSPLRELRRVANALNWLEWAAGKSTFLLTPGDLDRKRVVQPFTTLAIADSLLALMPSELPVETTLSLRSRFPGLDLWTVGLCNGSVEYIPTAAMHDEGGYEGRSTVVARGSEEQMRDHVCTMLAGMGIAGRRLEN